MGFSHLTSGERKRLQQGILTPEAAVEVSARAAAKNPGGFWTTTWGEVIRGVGTAALNLVPGAGGVLSAGVGAYDKAHFQGLSTQAKAEYSAILAAKQKPAGPSRPYLETLPYAWSPDYGTMTGYTGGTYTYNGTPSSGASGLEEFSKLAEGITPSQWLIIAALVGLIMLSFLRR